MDKKSLVLSICSLLFIAMLNGCSSIIVHSKNNVTPRPYSGTNIALTKTKKLWYHYDFYGAVALTLFDVPFSFMADTLLYPIDVYRLNTISDISK